MSDLLSFNPKYAGHTIEDLQRVGLLGDEEAILELGHRCLEDEFYKIDGENITLECPHCGEKHKFVKTYHFSQYGGGADKVTLRLVENKIYNHAFTLGFSLSSINEGENVQAEEILLGLQKRLKELDELYSCGDMEILEAVGLPYDTYIEGE